VTQCILNKEGGRLWIGLIWLGIGKSEGPEAVVKKVTNFGIIKSEELVD
jgi:hypothetical protein